MPTTRRDAAPSAPRSPSAHPLTDPAFLVTAAAADVQPLLDSAADPAARLAAGVYRTSAHRHREAVPEVRRQLLALDAARWGAAELAAELAAVPLPDVAPAPWRVRWATGAELTPAFRCAVPVPQGGMGSVAALAVDGRLHVVTGDFDGRLRRWDPATGGECGAPLRGHRGVVHAVAAGWLGERPVLVSGGSDQTVRRWDLMTGQPMGRPLRGHRGEVHAVTVVQAGGRLLAVSGAKDRTLRVWDVATGELVGRPLTGHTDGVLALSATVAGGRAVIVSGGADGMLRAWDPLTGEGLGRPAGGPGWRTSVAALLVDGRLCAATNGPDTAAQVWDLDTGEQLGGPLSGHTALVDAVAAIELDGRPHVVTGSRDRTVRLWDAATGQPVGPPLVGHPAGVWALATSSVAGRPQVVGAGAPGYGYEDEEGEIRVWEPSAAPPTGLPGGHDRGVRAVTTVLLDGTAHVVTGGGDGTLRLWEAAGGRPVRRPLTGHTHAVYAVAEARLDAGRCLVSLGGDGTLRRWDPVTGTELGRPMPAGQNDGLGWLPLLATVDLNGRACAVTSGAAPDGAGVDDEDEEDEESETVRIWDLATGKPVGRPLTGGSGTVASLATVVVGGRPHALAGFHADDCGLDGTVLLWDLGTGKPAGPPLEVGEGEVGAVAAVPVGDHGYAIAGSEDGQVVIWDLPTRRPVGSGEHHHQAPVSAAAAALLAGRPYAATGCENGRVRVWDLTTGEPVGPALAFPLPVHALAWSTAGQLVVGFGDEVAVLERP
ncbi:WD40 repeat domain-containing protein [Kitasatospora sp. NPDC052896]|uniref:WD40 repeat domain-containing protein n=1 Tax=Kitasatospora sp. NPDC052896 TaxID=3364061 RepID=UPI0037C7507D